MSFIFNGAGSGGGGGTPGGADTQIQYNNAGAFGGASFAVVDAVDNSIAISKIRQAFVDDNISIQPYSNSDFSQVVIAGYDIDSVSNDAGTVSIRGGLSSTTGRPGSLFMNGGDDNGLAGRGGSVILRGGDTYSSGGEGGTLRLRAGLNDSACLYPSSVKIGSSNDDGILVTEIPSTRQIRIAFFSGDEATAVVKQDTSVSSAGFTANAGAAVNSASTFGGYTIGQIVQSLVNYGLLT